MATLTPRRLATLAMTLALLAVPSLVTALAAAPNCGAVCSAPIFFPHMFGF